MNDKQSQLFKFSKGQYDRAGARIVKPWNTLEDIAEQQVAYDVIGNWRSAHSVPLAMIRRCLQKVAKRVGIKVSVSQRLKRMFSIKRKLELQSNMKLTQMQDIGGCRAVCQSFEKVRQLTEKFKRSETSYEIINENDYISSPKESGYRGIHLVYKFNSNAKAQYNGLRIEIQLRTELQHAWATAVETVDTFLRQALVKDGEKDDGQLKTGQGSADWKRLFQLMGTAIALKEGCPPVPGTPTTSEEIRNELHIYAERLQIITRLSAYQATTTILTDPKQTAGFFLMELDVVKRNVNVHGYAVEDKAEAEYLASEKKLDPGVDAVLVSVSSLEDLRKAFPNYFLDTQIFMNLVLEALGKPPIMVSTPRELKLRDGKWKRVGE